MMIKRILTICAAVGGGAAVIPLAEAQQAYPVQPGTVYAPAPQPYPPGSAPNFDSVDDDDDAQALPPPGPGQGYARAYPQGPVMSPDDPRYGRPLYSDRNMPSGPVVSPDDPRYGRPAGAPPVYANGAAAPSGPAMPPDDPRYRRPSCAPPA